jgi:hypothetical protein
MGEGSSNDVPVGGNNTLWTDTRSRERIAGSPLLPDCVKWAEDGRVATVTDASIVISTFMSRELELYLQESPVISKSFIVLPEKNPPNERAPIKVPPSIQVSLVRVVVLFFHSLDFDRPTYLQVYLALVICLLYF